MAGRPKRSKPPLAMVERGPGGRLVPVGPYDQALIGQTPQGRLFDLVPRAQRSNPQQGLYWLVLGAVAEATGAWPTAEHLHEVLVRTCGFITPVLDIRTGTYTEARDSTAFDAMTPDAFNRYVDTAFAELSAFLGVDVLTLLPEKNADARA